MNCGHLSVSVSNGFSYYFVTFSVELIVSYVFCYLSRMQVTKAASLVSPLGTFSLRLHIKSFNSHSY